MTPPPRARSRRGEGERLRDALLAAASELLDESHDLDQLSVRAVTAKVGVSPTAFYLHFADKDELRRAIKMRCLGELGAAMRAARTAHEEPRAQLRAVGLAYLRYASEHPGHYAVLFHTRRWHVVDPATADEAIQEAALAVFATLVDVVHGCLPGSPTDPAEVATLFWVNLHGRAALQPAMPWFPFTDEQRYVALLVERCVGAD